MQTLENNNELKFEKNNEININQNNFLNSTLGKTINTGIDIGIRAIFPDFIDDQIITIKDNLINYGLKEGIQKTIDNAIDLGKSAIGIVTGNFENISQMQEAVKSGGIIDGISSVLDIVVNKVKEAGLINSTMANTIKQGKNLILNNVENNIQKTFENQTKSLKYIDKYMNNWKDYFNNKDFDGMEKEYYKLERELKNVVPIEKTINQARIIENLHNLIKSNGKNFELKETEIELANKLV